MVLLLHKMLLILKGVKVPQHLQWELEVSDLPEEVDMLPGLLHSGA